MIQKYGRPNYSVTEFLDAVNRNMPQLNGLIVYGVKIDELSSVHFKNVNEFSIGHCDPKNLPKKMPFSFEKLESLQLLEFTPSDRPTILDCLTNLNELLQLNFNPSRNYGNIDNDLQVIADKMTKLQEMTIHEYENSVGKQAIEQILLKCSTLRKLRIQFFYGIVSQRDKLMKELSDLPSKWMTTQRPRPTTYGIRKDLIIELKE